MTVEDGQNSIKVSVIVPAYNVESYIGECLQSLVSQTLKEIEIIVVNDGSTDGTGSIVESFVEKDERIFHIQQQNAGIAATRNKGASLAKGEYLYFIDSDDFIAARGLEILYEAASQNELSMVYGDKKLFYGNEIRFADLSLLEEGIAPLVIQDPVTFLENDANFEVVIWRYLLKREFWEQLSFGFAEGVLHEDCEFMPKCVISVDRIGVLDYPFYYYRKRRYAFTTTRVNTRKVKSLKENADRLHVFCERAEDAAWKPYMQRSVSNLTIRAAANSRRHDNVFNGNLKSWLTERKGNLQQSPKRNHRLIAWGFENMMGLTIGGLRIRYFLYDWKTYLYEHYRIWRSERVRGKALGI